MNEKIDLHSNIKDEWRDYEKDESHNFDKVSYNHSAGENINDLEYNFLLNFAIFCDTEEEEEADLLKIEQEILPYVKNSIYIAKITKENSREIIFYLNDPADVDFDFLKDQSKFLTNISIQYDKVKDVYWNYLRPTIYEWQNIINKETVEQLIKYKDNVETPRKIQHFINCTENTNIEEFKNHLVENFYTINQIKDINDQTKQIIISNKSDATHETINQISFSLIAAAQKYSAHYINWETNIIKNIETNLYKFRILHPWIVNY